MSNETQSPPPRLFMRAEVKARGHQLKEGKIGAYTVMCDEGTAVGGSGTAPSPLQYFFLSIGFCMLTQVERNAHALEIDVTGAAVTITGHLGRTGSIEEGTAQHGVTSVEIDIAIDSEAPATEVSELIRRSEAMCFVTQAVRNPVPTALTVALNGKSIPAE